MNTDTFNQSQVVGGSGDDVFCQLLRKNYMAKPGVANNDYRWDRCVYRGRLFAATLYSFACFAGIWLPDGFKTELKTDGYEGYNLCLEAHTLYVTEALVWIHWRPDDAEVPYFGLFYALPVYYLRQKFEQYRECFTPKLGTGQNGNADNYVIRLSLFVELFKPAVVGRTDCTSYTQNGRQLWIPTELSWARG